jgi:Fe-S cluster biogenesis protein NfuA
MTTRSAVEAVLTRLRPALISDGGDIELIELDGDVARVRLSGACAGCPTSHMTLYVGVETALRRVDPALRVAVVA